MEIAAIIFLVIFVTILTVVLFNLFYKDIFKRVTDIFCSLAVFIFLLPLWLILAILVRTKLGKPVLFTQIRPGKNGKLFKMYKFRSMTNETDDKGNLLPDEVRLTKFGKWLRKTSLDEMPEAINILKGDMSVIGPRPLLVKDYVFFDTEIMKRQDIRPGLSGLAQVEGRNNISWEDKFKYDLEYCKKVGFFYDTKLVFRSFFKAFIKKENVDRDGFATDEDYGDYLLRTKRISKKTYSDKIILSMEIIKNGKKHLL